MSSRGLQSLLGIGLAGVLFVAIVLLSNTLLQGFRIDLTSDRLYSISDETQQVLAGIDEPITLTFYFSHDESEGVPYVREYARRVSELLESYEARSNGRIRVRQVDPRPLSEARERAEQHELQPVPAGDGKEIFLGLSGTNQVGDSEVIEFFEPERERFLEYDLTRLIWSLKNPDPPRIGLLSGLEMTESMDPTTGERHPQWAVLDRIEDIAEIEPLRHPQDEIDEDLDALLVAHPEGYDDRTFYAIDQYLMRGGRVLMFADPVVDAQSGMREEEGQLVERISSSDPGPLLSGWGIELDLGQALADPRSGMVVQTQEGGRDVHPGLMRIQRDGMERDDPITAMIEQVVVASPGSIGVTDDGPQMQPLLRSAESAGRVAREYFVGFESPWEITRGLQPDGERHVIGARFGGAIRSAYPEGTPEEAEVDPAAHRDSGDGGELVLFADADLLTDQTWIRAQRGRSGPVRTPFAGNGDMIANAVEQLVGGELLGGIRARGTSARPFTRVQALEREAVERHRETQRELQTELQETEERVESLRAGGEDAVGGAILSDEQRAQLEEARERRGELRAELRRVEQRLDAEIDALGARLKFLNIVAVPLLVAVGASGVFLVRRRRQRRHQQRAT